MCGEYTIIYKFTRGRRGSPPRVRGIPFNGRHSREFGRITPACAGNTSSSHRSSCHHRDHPRVCGEYYGLYGVTYALWGSPPRVRGIHSGLHVLPLLQGITPACAGNTSQGLFSFSYLGDHPRVCGEYYTCNTLYNTNTGSPPRVRGIPFRG